jgi:glycosyltransferase involved in cell wall biosynthesis
MTNPLVSVITPVYNAATFIEACVHSVLSQTYTNWELWLVDDSSSDHSATIITRLAKLDSRIHTILLEQNTGVAGARNRAIKNANGKYIAFLDADDLWNPDKLYKQVSFMLQNKYVFSYTAYNIFTDNNITNTKTITCPLEVTYKSLLKHNTVGCLTVMYDAELLGKCYMPALKKRQDYALWLSILKGGNKGYGIQEPLAHYRVSKTSLSANKLSILKYNWLVLRNQEKLPLLHALYYFMYFIVAKTFKYLS